MATALAMSAAGEAAGGALVRVATDMLLQGDGNSSLQREGEGRARARARVRARARANARRGRR